MGWVTQDFMDVWRSGDHVGKDRPTAVVEVRSAKYRRNYRAWPGPPIGVTIPGEASELPWRPLLEEKTPWVQVPNVVSVDFTNSLEQKGCKVGTIVMDNVAYLEQTGATALTFHEIKPGYYSRNRGYVPDTRPDPGLDQNAWFNVLRRNANIRVWQGYGEPVRNLDGTMPDDGGPNGSWVFNGFVDDVDGDAVPAQQQITARMGKTLTDEQCFGWSKSKQLKDPITFYDSLEADTLTPSGYKAEASSVHAGDFAPSNVLDSDAGTVWHSQAHDTGAVTEWVEIRLDGGRYSDFVMECGSGMTAYVGILPKLPDDGGPAYIGAQAVPANQWFDGAGAVPGEHGGWDCAFIVSGTATGQQTIAFPFGEMIVGDNTILRIGFRDLIFTGGEFLATVRTLHGRRRSLHRTNENRQWMLVDDVSDVVRVVLRWAGYEEWDIEDTGVRLHGRFVVNRITHMMEILDKCCEQTGFAFFIADPPTGESMGIPTFRRPAALLREATAVALETTDTDVATGLKTKESDETMPLIIRVRGKEVATSEGGRRLGGFPVRRIMAVYKPPWRDEDPDMTGGILKRIHHQDNALRTFAEVWMGAYLIAVAAALASHEGTLEMAGNPLIELDDQVGVRVENTGTNSRAWATSIQSTMKLGEDATWTTNVAGALLDTQEMDAVIADILQGWYDKDGNLQDWTSETPGPIATGTRYRRIR